MVGKLRGRLSYKVAAAAAALALGCLLAAGIAAWTLAADLVREGAAAEAEAEAVLRAQRMGDLLAGLTLAMEKGVAPGPVIDLQPAISLNRSDPAAMAAIAASRPTSRIDGETLSLARPLVDAPGGPTALVYRLPLAELVGRAAGASALSLLYHEGEAEHRLTVGAPPNEAMGAEAIAAEAPVAVPRLLALHDFRVRIETPAAALDRRLARLAAAFAAFGLVTAAVATVAALLLGERVARPLARLDAAAAQGRTDPAEFAVPGDDEAARIGTAFAEMIRRLDEAYRDIERRSQTLLSNAERLARVGSAIWDFPTGHHQWSDEFHALLGLEPGDCVPSVEVFVDRLHPADRPRMVAALERAIADGHPIVEDVRIIRPDGEVRVIHGQAEVVLGDDGKPLRMNSAIQDITERKRLEERLDGLVRELRRSNEELEQFAYVASHDLRQPLRAVGSYVTLLEEDLAGKLDAETRQYIEFARDGVRRMDRLITDLLTYSRVGRTAKDGPIEVAEAVRGAIADLQHEIDDCGAAVEVVDPLPVVQGDRIEMVRLFQNLLGNALKYRRPDAAPRVSLSCEGVGNEWWFAVGDDGIGIPPEHAERVFGIFQRLHARDEYEGTGVGLAICRKIVERHGGRIWVDSTSSGTVIRFTWPKTCQTA